MTSVSLTSLLRCLALPHIAELSVNVRVLQSPGIRVCTALEPCTNPLGNWMLMNWTRRLRLEDFSHTLTTSSAGLLPAFMQQRQEFILSRFKYHSLYSLGLRVAHE